MSLNFNYVVHNENNKKLSKTLVLVIRRHKMQNLFGVNMRHSRDNLIYGKSFPPNAFFIHNSEAQYKTMLSHTTRDNEKIYCLKVNI